MLFSHYIAKMTKCSDWPWSLSMICIFHSQSQAVTRNPNDTCSWGSDVGFQVCQTI